MVIMSYKSGANAATPQNYSAIVSLNEVYYCCPLSGFAIDRFVITSADIAEIEDQDVHSEKLRDRITMQLYNSLTDETSSKEEEAATSETAKSTPPQEKGDEDNVYTKRQAKSPEFKPEEW